MLHFCDAMMQLRPESSQWAQVMAKARGKLRGVVVGWCDIRRFIIMVVTPGQVERFSTRVVQQKKVYYYCSTGAS